MAISRSRYSYREVCCNPLGSITANDGHMRLLINTWYYLQLSALVDRSRLEKVQESHMQYLPSSRSCHTMPLEVDTCPRVQAQALRLCGQSHITCVDPNGSGTNHDLLTGGRDVVTDHWHQKAVAALPVWRQGTPSAGEREQMSCKNIQRKQLLCI